MKFLMFNLPYFILEYGMKIYDFSTETAFDRIKPTAT